MNQIRKLTIVFVALAGASVAQATPIIVTTEAEFLLLVNSVQTEGFEGYPTENCAAGGSSPSSSISTSLLSVTTSPQDGGTSFLCIGEAGGGPVPTDGLNALVAGSTTGDSWILTFSLLDPVDGIGFYLKDAAEAGDAFFSLPGGDDFLIASCCLPSGSTTFFGILFDEPFSEFELINTGRSDGWAIDQVIMATVPEPGTLALLGIGLAGMGLSRRRKQPS